MIIFVGCLVLAGLLLFPRLFGSTARTGNRELPVVLALVTCLLATWMAWRLGLSPALGAFVAGLVLADSPFARQIRADVSVFKTVFLTLFFATIGMLADIPWLLTGINLWIVLAASFGIMFGKLLLAALAARSGETADPDLDRHRALSADRRVLIRDRSGGGGEPTHFAGCLPDPDVVLAGHAAVRADVGRLVGVDLHPHRIGAGPRRSGTRACGGSAGGSGIA